MVDQIAIVFGAGKNIGDASVQTFRAKGFKVARVSRSVEEGQEDDLLSIPCDLTRPTTVSDVFEKVRKTWGEPSVIVYNAYAMHLTKPDKTFSISLQTFEDDLAINHTSAYAALYEALASFQALPSAAPKTFIYTGNILNEGPVPGLLTLGVGKIASAHMVEMADDLYKGQNIRFFFVDERMTDGTPMFIGAGPQVHADMFVALADRSAGDLPWQVTFLADKGFVEFPHKVLLPDNMKAIYDMVPE